MKNIKPTISTLRLLIQIIYLLSFIFGVLTTNYVILFINITAILLGPVFCGWMCFVGLYQDIFKYLGNFFIKKTIKPNKNVQKYIQFLRYLIYIASITIGGIFLFPGQVWGSFAGLAKGYLTINTAFYFIVTLGIFSLFSTRFFCRYLCTFGAKLGIYSLLRIITINKHDSCSLCKRCSQACPMAIEIDKVNSLANPNCINCLRCVESCPNDSLKIGIRDYLKP